ncbi:Uncharacterised protein [Mycobacterium tuberculosis]|nr:Uncharacterised protein [Mycobacterium tuberculosis]COW64761.1 Uncharacterised protein [Mycobacterium tuberculosis]COW78588.1 Uncharacterised protein [Mycobacterium tuberculosis]
MQSNVLWLRYNNPVNPSLIIRKTCSAENSSATTTSFGA